MAESGIRSMTIRAGLWLLAAALIFGLGFHFGGLRSEARLSDYKAKAERAIAQAAKAETAASEHARAVEKASQEKADRLAEAYEQDKQNAQESADKLVGDLRAGNVRLKRLWEAERATDRLSDQSEATRHADEIARLRQEAIGRVRGIGEEADAQVRGLQQYARDVSQ